MELIPSVKVEQESRPDNTAILDVIWKRLSEGEITITVKGEGADSRPAVSLNEKPAGWLRARPLAGL